MFVGFAANDVPHNHVGDFMKSSKGSDGSIRNSKLIAKLSRLRVCEHGVIQSFAFVIYAAPLCLHIPNVVFGRAKKQMAWIHAAWVIALMQAIEIVRTRTICQRVGKAVRLCQSLTIPKSAIAMLVTRRCPRPAFIRAALFYLFPKTFFGRANLADSGSMTDAIAHWLPFDMTPFSIATSGNWGRLSTATFAEFNRGIASGMIAHSNNLLQASVAQAWDVSSVARRFVLVGLQYSVVLE